MAKNDWYKSMVVYQIWPRSFCDGNGDGIGDLWGVLSKLDYIKSLGVDAIWFSPLYPSPNADFGYDVADYKNINPEYGDLEVFKEVLDGRARARDARVHGPRGEPHLRRARVVQAEPGHPQPVPELLLLAAGPAHALRRDEASQQLGQSLRGRRLGARPPERGVLPPHLRQEAARPQPRQPRRARGGQEHHALLAGHGRGRLPRGRHHLHLQDPGACRTPFPSSRRRRACPST